MSQYNILHPEDTILYSESEDINMSSDKIITTDPAATNGIFTCIGCLFTVYPDNTDAVPVNYLYHLSPLEFSGYISGYTDNLYHVLNTQLVNITYVYLVFESSIMLDSPEYIKFITEVHNIVGDKLWLVFTDEIFFDDEQIYFDVFSDIIGIDNGQIFVIYKPIIRNESLILM